MKPELKTFKKPERFADLPNGTYFEAGHLVTKNAGWRTKRPVLDDQKCTGCLQCYLYCPDGVIRKENGKVMIDYDFCKGCGICVKICKTGAIRMEAQR
jgi:pyruvate ferredoxin oxidoreductase delta subunit/pyruvate ferredoxin oxidoreductase gamma subunit